MWAEQPIGEWIDSVCRQYSRLTGRMLVFDSQIGSPASDIQPPRIVAHEQWRTAICDGTQTVGVLRLCSPAGHARDADYLQACQTAELAALLIEQVVATRADEEPFDNDRPAPHTILERRRPGNSAGAHRNAAKPSPAANRIERLLDVLRKLTHFPAAALLVQAPGADGQQLSTIRTSEVCNLPPQLWIDCLAAVNDLGQRDDLTILRRAFGSPEESDCLPAGVATGVVTRLGGSTDHSATLCMFDRRDRRLTRRDQHVIESVSRRLEQQLNQTRILAESSHSRQLTAEMLVASQSQPSAPMHYVGAHGWCELAGCTQSGKEIGGDLCEVIPLSGERLFVAIGDAAGHSIPAAIVMASVRGAIRTLFDQSRQAGRLPDGCPPHEVMRCVNSVLYGIVQAHQFMSLFCGILDRKRMTLEYANAGHPPPLLLREGEVISLKSHGLVLGVVDDTSYEQAVVPMKPGDVLTLYTDGVTEAVSPEGAFFGTQGIENRMLQSRERSVTEIRDKLWSALQQHSAGSTQADDRTLAVLRIGPDEPLTRHQSLEL